jgi:hypothetical protein
MRVDQTRRQGVGLALLLLAREFGEPAKACWVLKALGLGLADLQEAGFTEADLKPLKKGWLQVQGPKPQDPRS